MHASVNSARVRYFERLTRGETPTAAEWDEYLRAFHSRYENVTSGPWSVLRTADGETSYQLLARRAREIAPTAKSIVDIGCGDGLLLRRVRTQFPDAELVGIDFSEDEIDRARSLFDGATFLCGDAREIELGANHYDLALLHLTLAVASRPERLLRAAQTALRAKGALIALTERSPAHSSLASIVEAGLDALSKMHGSFEPFFPNVEMLRDDAGHTSMLRTAGFEGRIESEEHAVAARFTRSELWAVVQRFYPFGLLGDAEQERVQAAIDTRAWQPESDGKMEIRVNLRIISAC